MFNATYFTYGGIFSGEFGLQIADFNEESVIETDTFSPSLNTIKIGSGRRFAHNGVTYESHPTHEFSILSERVIDDAVRRDILSWLVGRREYKTLVIHQSDLEQYWYKCVFTNIRNIYVGGHCHGFRITANFDSPYQYGSPTTIEVSGAGAEQIVTITNKSDTLDEYTFPIVEITVSTSLDSSALRIVNYTDDSNRVCSVSGLNPREYIRMDGEMRHIISDTGKSRLGDFNKNWVRLLKGTNIIGVTVHGVVKITCPQYAMLGF